MPRVIPTKLELERFLFASGMIASTPTAAQQYLDLALALDAAHEDFKRDVGLPYGHPFLAESSATIRYYDTQGGPYVQIPPYFTIAYVTAGTSFETTSETKTSGTDWLKSPEGDPPYTMLEFAGYYRAGPQRIGVNGRRGWTDDLPADVFQAILRQAASVHLQPSLATAINNGAVSWQEGDVSEKYGPMGAYSAFTEACRGQYWQTVSRYQQVKVHGAGRV